jgi:hypothetical protein
VSLDERFLHSVNTSGEMTATTSLGYLSKAFINSLLLQLQDSSLSL